MDEMDEHTEGTWIGMLARARRELGADAFREAATRAVLPFEEELRRTCPRDHPALVMLDEWHAEQRRRERGFE